MSATPAAADPARRPLRLLAWGAAVLAVASVAVAVDRFQDRDADPEEAGEGSGAAVTVGPADGAEVDAYVAERTEALAGAQGDRVAVVSLTSYRRPSGVQRVVDGVAADAGPVEVVGWLVALPGGAPEDAGLDLAAWAQAAAAQAAAERVEIEVLLPTVEASSPFLEFYRRELERLGILAAGIDPDGEHVFAVGVRAPAAALRLLAEEGEVRLVDVGPSAGTGPLTMRGLRPEELERAGDPAIRPT